MESESQEFVWKEYSVYSLVSTLILLSANRKFKVTTVTVQCRQNILSIHDHRNMTSPGSADYTLSSPEFYQAK